MNPRVVLLIALLAIALGAWIAWGGLRRSIPDSAAAARPAPASPPTLRGGGEGRSTIEPGGDRRKVLPAGPARISGRVVDRLGRGLDQAWAFLLDGEGGELSRVPCRSDGRFELEVRRAGRFRVCGWAQAEGLGFVEVHARPPEREHLGDLRVEAAEVIEGRVVFADGMPVTDLRLHFLWDGHAAPAGAERQYPIADTPGAFSVRTDADGTFHATGLRHGVYRLEPAGYFGRSTHRFATGTRDARITLALHRIRVRARDHRDRPAAIPELSWSVWDPPQAALAAAVFDDPARPLDQLPALTLGGRPFELSRHHGLDFWGRPASFWLFHAFPAGFAPVTRRLRVPSDGNETWVTLTLVPLGRPGWIEISARDLRASDPILTEIIDPDSAATLWIVRNQSRQELPPGRYEARIHPGNARLGLRDYFEERRQVQVVAGQTTRIEIRARAGGRVRVRLQLPDDLSPAELASTTVSWRPLGVTDYVRMRDFLYPDTTGVQRRGSSFRPRHPFLCATLLAPGTHVLRVTATGCHPAEETVFVRARQTSEVTIVLRRR